VILPAEFPLSTLSFIPRTELDAIILARLQQTVATWSTLDARLLTASDEKALLLLAAAGFMNAAYRYVCAWQAFNSLWKRQ
jgi:hypothetical protein